MPYLTGEVEHSPSSGFFYFSDDGDLVAMRFGNWKAVFMEQRCQGTMRIWAEPFTQLLVPKLFTLMAAKFLDTFEEFPPRHPPASFSIDPAVEKLHHFLGKG